ncbi:MAG: helical backbone metal receptor [Verrucomicrobiia bacterium]
MKRLLILTVFFAAAAAFAAPPQRIVSTAPAFTEMLFAIGAGGQVVGVTGCCFFPPEARQREKIGGYTDVSYEKLLSLKPDLVVTADYALRMREHCATAKFATLELKTNSVGDILNAIEQLGRVTGHDKEARALAGSIRGELQAIRAASHRPPRRALLVIGRARGSFQELLSVGPGGFLDDLLSCAGGTNVLADVNQPWPRINLETVLARKPEVIIEMVGEAMGDRASANEVGGRKQEWNRFSGVPAVAIGRVNTLLSDHALIPGPRLVDTARVLAELLR